MIGIAGYGIALPPDFERAAREQRQLASMIDEQLRMTQAKSAYGQLLGLHPLAPRVPRVPPGWADWYAHGDQLH